MSSLIRVPVCCRCFCRGLCPCLCPLTTRWAVVSSLIRVPVCCRFCRGLCPCLCPLTTRWAVVSSLIRVPVCCRCFCRGLCPCLCPLTTRWAVVSSLIRVPVCCRCFCRGLCPCLCPLTTKWAVMSSLILVMVTIVIVPAENSVPVRVLSLQGGLFSPVTVPHCFCRGLCPCLCPLTTWWAVMSSLILVMVTIVIVPAGNSVPVRVLSLQGGLFSPVTVRHCFCRGLCPCLCPLTTRWAVMSSLILVVVTIVIVPAENSVPVLSLQGALFSPVTARHCFCRG